jgi:elongation factor G
VIDYLPAPDEVDAPAALRPATRARVERPPDPQAPFLGFVFKTHSDPQRGRDCFVRIYSGTLREGMSLTSPRVKGYERAARLFRVHADKRRAIKEASAGTSSSSAASRTSPPATPSARGRRCSSRG